MTRHRFPSDVRLSESPGNGERDSPPSAGQLPPNARHAARSFATSSGAPTIRISSLIREGEEPAAEDPLWNFISQLPVPRRDTKRAKVSAGGAAPCKFLEQFSKRVRRGAHLASLFPALCLSFALLYFPRFPTYLRSYFHVSFIAPVTSAPASTTSGVDADRIAKPRETRMPLLLLRMNSGIERRFAAAQRQNWSRCGEKKRNVLSFIRQISRNVNALCGTSRLALNRRRTE